MIQENICYDEVRDLQKVEPSGWIDLAAANAMGSVPAIASSPDLVYNGIEDPRSAHRFADQFEEAQAAKVITDYKPPKKDE